MSQAIGPSRAFRRSIRVATRIGIARAVVEDDFHHFRVEIEHDGGLVSRALGRAIRFPYTTCPMAAERLNELLGMSLSTDATAVRARTDQLLHCTHFLDLAGLAIATAARGLEARHYEATVADRLEGKTRPTLLRDSCEVLIWEVDGHVIRGPAPYAGVGLRAGFVDWANRTLAPEEAEAAIVLRRAVFVSGGRGRDLDAMKTAPPRGGCYTQQPERAPFAHRVVGSTRDVTERSREAAAADSQWLAFDGENSAGDVRDLS
jgi:Protein of unknown function (DUF2889)